MKKLFVVIFFLNCFCGIYAQQKKNDSLKRLLAVSKSDSATVYLKSTLAHNYLFNKPDSSFLLAQEGLVLAKKNHYLKGEEACYQESGEATEQMGNYPAAMKDYLKFLQVAEKLNIQLDIANALIDIGLLYQNQEDYGLAINYTLRAKSIIESIDSKKKANYYDAVYDAMLVNIGYFYYKENRLDSALNYEQSAYVLALRIHNEDYMGNILLNLGLIHEKLGNKILGITFYRMSIKKSDAIGDNTTLTETYMTISNYYNKANNIDSCVFFSKRALKTARAALYIKGILEASTSLAELYGKNDKELAYDYLKIATVAKDSLFSMEKIKQVQKLKLEEQVREQEIADLKAQHEEEREHNLQVSLIALFIPVFFLVLLLLSKIKVHHRIIEFMSILSILFLFEFFTLLIYPVVGGFSNHSPWIEFLIFVCVAAVMVPTHHHLTDWLKTRLTHMSKWGRHPSPEMHPAETPPAEMPDK